MAAARKLQPRWSAPRRVVTKIGNSYTLSTLEGFPLSGLFNARRLRRFLPRNGTTLAALQEALCETTTNDDEEHRDEWQELQQELDLEAEFAEDFEDDE